MKNLPATKKFSNHLLVIKKRLHYNNVRIGCKAAVLKQWPLKTVVEMQDHIPVFVLPKTVVYDNGCTLYISNR